MRNNLIKLLSCVVLSTSLLLTGCGSSGTDKNASANNTEKKSIKLGSMSTFTDFIAFVPEKMKELGYDVEIITFDDVTTPDTALAEGSIDCNFYQHKPYLDAYNKSNGTDLVACEPQLIASMDCVISTKYASLEELPDGAKIGISDDPSNLSANLNSLAFLKLIKLKDIPKDSYHTTFDIVENPHNFEFVELPMAQKAAALPELDAIVTFYGKGISGKANVLRLIDDNPVVAFPVIMAVDGKNKEEKWVKDLMKIVASDDFKKVVDEKNKDVKTWKILFN